MSCDIYFFFGKSKAKQKLRDKVIRDEDSHVTRQETSMSIVPEFMAHPKNLNSHLSMPMASLWSSFDGLAITLIHQYVFNWLFLLACLL